MSDTNDYAWLDRAIYDAIRRFDSPDQIRAIARELTAERGFILNTRSAQRLAALALIAAPLSLATEGQAEFVSHHILRTAAHSAEPKACQLLRATVVIWARDGGDRWHLGYNARMDQPPLDPEIAALLAKVKAQAEESKRIIAEADLLIQRSKAILERKPPKPE